ncbi:GIY-YIG nuclease family protein [Thalassotalea euphylliae]|uniref:GIY-YIG nuclease family protein n=1 Tax=Thalassotalea euphylliae TaxID=1655234 RepID=A0A3E0UIX7_9GAMM|nr:GIY-YIG nuclease family protein [Thalassotalea euphylliae]REL36849.1 GIY-YIG nuclease family protein [Thalassotalea euphylliae]
MSQPWYVYLLRCADNSLYCGVTTDLNRRVIEHNQSPTRGAKYTRVRRPVELVYSETHASKSLACQREYAIKQLSKSKKEVLVKDQQKNTLV